MKQLFAYIRVSDPKQKTGVSLIEQRAIIERYVERIGAEVAEWFEETRTAAKAGRPVFSRMVKLLRDGRASGVVIHKLDRGTRNFRDWAEIDELIESGIEVHVANENLDLRSRGGRLAADVQIAVAVDYIRNLREEALKGIHGRLKQGILPNGVGIGYRDAGAGKPKIIDAEKGLLVKRLFELYASGEHTLRDTAAEADRIGLRNRNGRALRMQEIHRVLRNPFYAGIIRSRRFGLFAGAHEPLISKALFDRVQKVLDGKIVRRTKHHEFIFRRLLKCQSCDRCLIGSAVKGFVYYRCSNISCPTTCVREDRVEREIRDTLRTVRLTADESALVHTELANMTAADEQLRINRRQSLTAALKTVIARLSRLTDLVLDDTIRSEEYNAKREALVSERITLEQNLARDHAANEDVLAATRRIVELAEEPEILYSFANPAQKRQLIEITMSNLVVNGKSVVISLREPFATIAGRRFAQTCGQLYDTPLTFLRGELELWGQDWPRQLILTLQNTDFPSKNQVAA